MKTAFHFFTPFIPMVYVGIIEEHVFAQRHEHA
ncbi:hypothetical protein EAPG_01411 [Escherichia albertii B156]|nr:hypothetical protein EAPG_01411 [Escherichia albertii B156]